MIALLRERPQTPVLLLHDASLQGVLLRHRLLTEWKLAPNHRIIDLGLRPAQVWRQRWPYHREPVSPPLLKLLEAQARTPGALALDQKEIAWLGKGYVTSVRFIPSPTLVQGVVKAVERLVPVRPLEADPERQAQLEAQAIGYMSWPSR